MKKLVLVLVLAAVVVVGGVFADHPSGWGVGPGFQYGGSWRASGVYDSGLSLFLKVPGVPVYWGITADLFDMGYNPSLFGVALTGDYYLFDQYIVPEAKLGWFLGVGGYFKFHRSSFASPVNSDWDYASNTLDFGLRVPIGLSWQPINWLEIFFDIAPSIGFYYRSYSGGSRYVAPNSASGLGGGWAGDFGLRFWF